MNGTIQKGKAYYERFVRCDISTKAAALAFHTVLGIVPTLGLLFWYLAYSPLTDQWLNQTKSFILQHLTIDSGNTFATYFEKLTSKVDGTSWGWIGLFIFLYTIWNLIAKFGQGLDFIITSRESEDPPEPIGYLLLYGRRAIAMLFLPIALAFSIALSQWVSKDSWLHYIFEFKTIGKYIAIPFAWLGSIFATTLIYYFIPSRPIRFVEALKAGCLAGPLSEIVRNLFGMYNARAVSVHKIYGVLAVVPMFILWIQVAWMVLLSCAFVISLPVKKTPRTQKE